MRYASYANEQLSQLPRPLRTFDARVEDLKDDPYVAGDYNEDIGSYSDRARQLGRLLTPSVPER